MNPALAFWTGSFFLFASMLTTALFAWRHIRAGRVDLHRRFIRITLVLLALFLLSYVTKVLLLGKEHLALWSPASIFVLRLHETLILIMLLAGGGARSLARRARREAGGTPWHRWLGRTAMLSGVAAFLTASLVLLGMYGRAFGGP